ncbi:main capsid protein [Oenococcus phage Vinitor-27]|nr:main capsid protein [Oenococcus phage Vinitor-27]
MANAVNYVNNDNFANALDMKIKQGLITSVFPTPSVDYTQNAKSFYLRNVITSGFGPHSRNGGWNRGSISDEKKLYEMTQDRDVEFFVDKMDVDETNNEVAAATISSQFVTYQATPEIDAYRFSKLASIAAANPTDLLGYSHYAQEEISNANIYTRLKEAILPLRKYGQTNMTGFVSTETMDALERSTETTRYSTDQNVGTTALESRITSLDGVKLIEVWDLDRFYDSFDFSNGFNATTGSRKINFMFVTNTALIPIVKEQAVYLFTPGQHTEGDGYLYQNRLYHDIFVRQSQIDGVYVSVGATTLATANASSTDIQYWNGSSATVDPLPAEQSSSDASSSASSASSASSTASSSASSASSTASSATSSSAS